MTKRRVFSREFKLEAVGLMKHRPAAELARELGVPRKRLYKWRDEVNRAGGDAFPGSGVQAGEAGEVARLQRELEALRKEHEFLKKAVRYFAKEPS